MRTLSIICVAGAAFTALAVADSTTKSDRKGDSKRGEFDLKSATVRHAGRDTFQHIVTTYNTSKRERSLRLDISTGGGGLPGYGVMRPEGKAGVYRYTRRGPKRVGPARFKKHSSRKFSYTFSLEHMGLPTRYRWQWAVQVRDSFEPADRLPNRGMVSHDVGHGD